MMNMSTVATCSTNNSKDGLFPEKLYDLLEYADQVGLASSIISWTNEGKAFEVYDREQLVNTLLPLFFGQTKYKSFERQLNMWSFDRIVTSTVNGKQITTNKTFFRHPYFIRGQLKTLMMKHNFCRDSFKRKPFHQTIKKNNSVTTSKKNIKTDGQQKQQRRESKSKCAIKKVISINSIMTASRTSSPSSMFITEQANYSKMEKGMMEEYKNSLMSTIMMTMEPSTVVSSSSLPSSSSATKGVSMSDDELKSQMMQVEALLNSPSSSIKPTGGNDDSWFIDVNQPQQQSQQSEQQNTFPIIDVIRSSSSPVSNLEMIFKNSPAPTPITTTRGSDFVHGDLVEFEGRSFHFLDLGLANF